MPYASIDTQRAYQREWVAARRRAFFLGERCAECWGRERLELHHVDPAAKVTHRIWTWRRSAFDAERQKCIVLCHACHQRRHWPLNREHGQITMYKAGCRCQPCRASNAERCRNQRRAKGR